MRHFVTVQGQFAMELNTTGGGFCHCTGAVCHRKSTVGSMCHFVTGQGQFAMDNKQHTFGVGGIVTAQGHFPTEKAQWGLCTILSLHRGSLP